MTLRGIGTHRNVSRDSKLDDAIEAKLDEEVTLDVKDAPLTEVATLLGKQIDAPIIVDRLALEEIGLTPDTPVTIRLESVSGRAMLRIMLRELDLTYQAKGGVIQITSIEAAEQNLVSQIHFLESTGFTRTSDAMQVIQTTVVCDTWEALGGPSTMVPMLVGPHQRPAVLASTTSDVHAQIHDLLRTLRAAEN